MIDLIHLNAPRGKEQAVQEPFSTEDPYELEISKVRDRTVETARRFLEKGKKVKNYRFSSNFLHATDCSGMVHRVLFNGFKPKDNSAQGYFAEAEKNNYLIRDPFKNIPQPGDVYFQGKGHTGIVENCWQQGSGLYCSVINAAGDESCPNTKESRCRVSSDLIYRDESQKWHVDYNSNSKGKFDASFEQDTFQFADSLKMRGIPTKREVDPLGGVDLNASLPLDNRDLALGALQGFRVSADGSTLTLYASKTDSTPNKNAKVRGINPMDLVEMLKSFQRKAGSAPTFTLLPDAETGRSINKALSNAQTALGDMQFFEVPFGGDHILYGNRVWNFLGLSEPPSFPMRAIFSDSGLKNTHAGEVLMQSDLLLKTLMFGDLGISSPTSFMNRAAKLARQGKQLGLLEPSRIWFEVAPDSFVINRIQEPDGSTVYDFDDVRLQVQCRPVELGGSFGPYDTGDSCSGLPQSYTDHLNKDLEKIAKKHPVLLELKELYKASALAKVLYQKGVRLSNATQDQDPAWETKESAPFYPILYITSPNDEGRSSLLMGIGMGGVNLDVPLDQVVHEAAFTENSFYKNPLNSPIADVSEGMRAVRFKIKGHTDTMTKRKKETEGSDRSHLRRIEDSKPSWLKKISDFFRYGKFSS